MQDDRPTAAAAPSRRFAWVRTAAGKLPTKWFAAIGSGLVLAATAAFGGLEAVPPTPIVELTAGMEHTSPEVNMTVQRAVLLDAFPEAGITVDEGERVLALVVDAENAWDQPIRAARDSAVADSLRLPDGTAPDTVARMDDATFAPWLQPGLPVTIVVSFAVDGDAYADGEELAVQISDRSLTTGSLIVSGEYWSEPVHVATVTVPIEDRGDGSGS